jgi:hypothetical protein
MIHTEALHAIECFNFKNQIQKVFETLLSRSGTFGKTLDHEPSGVRPFCIHRKDFSSYRHRNLLQSYLSGCLTFCIQTHARPSSSRLDLSPILPIDVALAGKEIQPQQMKSPKPWA